MSNKIIDEEMIKMVEGKYSNNFVEMSVWNTKECNEKAYQFFCSGGSEKGDANKKINEAAPLLQFVNKVEKFYFTDTRKLTTATREWLLKGVCLRLFAYPTFEDSVLTSEWNEENSMVVTYLNALNMLFDRNRKEDLIFKSYPSELSNELVDTIKKNLSQVMSLGKVSLEPLWDMLRKYLPRYLEDGFFVAILPYFIFYHIVNCSISSDLYHDSSNVLNVWRLPFQHFEIAKDSEWFYTKNMEWVRYLHIPIEDVYQIVHRSLETVFVSNKLQTMGSSLAMKGCNTDPFTVFAFSKNRLIDQLSNGFVVKTEHRDALKSELEKEWDRIFNC